MTYVAKTSHSLGRFKTFTGWAVRSHGGKFEYAAYANWTDAAVHAAKLNASGISRVAGS